MPRALQVSTAGLGIHIQQKCVMLTGSVEWLDHFIPSFHGKCILFVKSFCLFITEKNGLLFMETSALESTNVEVAFNGVLAGKLYWSLTVLNFDFEIVCTQQQTKVLIYEMCIPIPLQRSIRKCPAERSPGAQSVPWHWPAKMLSPQMLRRRNHVARMSDGYFLKMSMSP